MARYDDTFVNRFLEPWNRHDVDGALALMPDDCVWEVTRGREPHGTLYTGRAAVRSAIVERSCPQETRTKEKLSPRLHPEITQEVALWRLGSPTQREPDGIGRTESRSGECYGLSTVRKAPQPSAGK